MDNGSKILGWLGLIVGGVLSVGANVRSIHLPEMPPADAGSYVVAVAPVILAMIGIEQVSRWTHLPNALRFGVVGIASLIAAVASWTHIVSVLQHYGQPDAIAYSFPVAVDGIMLLSSVALFVSFPSTVQPDTDADTVRTDTRTDSADTMVPDTIPDTWTLDTVDTIPAPTVRTDSVDSVDRIVVPVQRRTRTDAGWKAAAMDMIRTGDPATDREIAEKILADAPDTWSTVEAGRKAVSRLRASA